MDEIISQTPPIIEPISEIIPDNIPKKKLPIWVWIIPFLFIFLLYIIFKQQQLLTTSKQEISENIIPTTEPTQIPSSIVEKSKSVLIYAEKINEVKDDKDRFWPTYKIYKVIDNSQPEIIVPSIGQVGEYPSLADFILSPDKQSLLINLRKRLVMINLKTKEQKNILEFKYIDERNDNGVVFSPDSQKLFILEHEEIDNSNNNDNYTAYTFNLLNGEKNILKQGTTRQAGSLNSLFPKKWRADNKIILFEPMGSGSYLWVFDMNSNNFEKKEQQFGQINNDGTIMAEEHLSVDDPCNDYSGSDIGGYELIDPVTLAIKDRLDGNKKVINLVAISPNNDQFIYFASDTINLPISEDKSNCDELYKNQTKTKQYYIKRLGEAATPISDYQSILKTWGVNIEAKTIYNTDNNSSYIQNGNQKITGSNPNSFLEIITQFYQ